MSARAPSRRRRRRSGSTSGGLRVGVDGCPGGWLAVFERGRAPLVAEVFPSLRALVGAAGAAAWIGIDIPIGLAERGARACELQARQRLGRPRMASVFPAPLRACLRAGTYAQACQIRAAIEGRKMSRQAFNILPKIREVDRFLRRDAPARLRVAEVHPECSFDAWRGHGPSLQGKKTAAGRAERAALIGTLWPAAAARLWPLLRGRGCAMDDLHDAFAALWTVRRWQRGAAVPLGEPGAVDRYGLPMRILI